MSLDVNLSIEQEKKEPISRVLIASVIFAVVATGAYFAVTFYNFLLGSQINSLEEQIDDVAVRKEQFLTSQDSFAVLGVKMGSIAEILDTRAPVDTRLSQVFSQLPDGVSAVRMDAQADSTRMSLVSESLSSLNTFLDVDLAEISSADPTIEKIDVLSFGRTEEGNGYVAVVLITYVVS